MIYMLVPHVARSRLDVRMFDSFSSVEQLALRVARALESEGKCPDWCEIIAYDGMDEMYPAFIYTLLGSFRLHRDHWPSPSS